MQFFFFFNEILVSSPGNGFLRLVYYFTALLHLFDIRKRATNVKGYISHNNKKKIVFKTFNCT